MTFNQLISSINTKLTRIGEDRVSAPDILAACLDIANFFASQIVDSLPMWNVALTFQTDGTGSGKYCIYADTNGKKRIFQTKVDDNTGNAPPNNPNITENAFWEEVSSSAVSSIQEWAAGVFPPGLAIVFHNHSTQGRGLYILLEPTRPFASADIEDEIAAGQWERLFDKEHLTISEADTSGAVIALNFSSSRQKMFRSSDVIDGDATVQFNNAATSLELKSWKFEVDAADRVLTMPANAVFVPGTAGWDPATSEWTSFAAGKYEITGTYDSEADEWLLKLYGNY